MYFVDQEEVDRRRQDVSPTMTDGNDQPTLMNEREYRYALESSFVFDAEPSGILKVENVEEDTEEAGNSVPTNANAPLAIF